MKISLCTTWVRAGRCKDGMSCRGLHVMDRAAPSKHGYAFIYCVLTPASLKLLPGSAPAPEDAIIGGGSLDHLPTTRVVLLPAGAGAAGASVPSPLPTLAAASACRRVGAE